MAILGLLSRVMARTSQAIVKCAGGVQITPTVSQEKNVFGIYWDLIYDHLFLKQRH